MATPSKAGISASSSSSSSSTSTTSQHAKLEDFTVLKQLGKGAFGIVLQVRHKQHANELFALKKVDISRMSRKEISDCLGEIRFLASIHHPNIIRYVDSFTASTDLCIVMEYADGGDLSSKVEKHMKAGAPLEEDVIWALFVQLLSAVSHLHSLQILHRDLKTANVFLTKDGQVKIGDLNVSKLATAGLVKTQIGTPYYMSPEIWRGDNYDCKADMWSLGCILYELCSLRPPFRGKDLSELSKRILTGHYSPPPATYSKDMHAVIEACLQLNPNKRPNAAELLLLPNLATHRERLKNTLNETLRKAAMTEAAMGANSLLDTIAIPAGGMKALRDALPAPQYGSGSGSGSGRRDSNGGGGDIAAMMKVEAAKSNSNKNGSILSAALRPGVGSSSSSSPGIVSGGSGGSSNSSNNNNARRASSSAQGEPSAAATPLISGDRNGKGMQQQQQQPMIRVIGSSGGSSEGSSRSSSSSSSNNNNNSKYSVVGHPAALAAGGVAAAGLVKPKSVNSPGVMSIIGGTPIVTPIVSSSNNNNGIASPLKYQMQQQQQQQYRIPANPIVHQRNASAFDDMSVIMQNALPPSGRIGSGGSSNNSGGGGIYSSPGKGIGGGISSSNNRPIHTPPTLSAGVPSQARDMNAPASSGKKAYIGNMMMGPGSSSSSSSSSQPQPNQQRPSPVVGLLRVANSSGINSGGNAVVAAAASRGSPIAVPSTFAAAGGVHYQQQQQQR